MNVTLDGFVVQGNELGSESLRNGLVTRSEPARDHQTLASCEPLTHDPVWIDLIEHIGPINETKRVERAEVFDLRKWSCRPRDRRSQSDDLGKKFSPGHSPGHMSVISSRWISMGVGRRSFAGEVPVNQSPLSRHNPHSEPVTVMTSAVYWTVTGSAATLP